MKWIEDLKAKYTSGVSHAFILHLNISDTIGGMDIKSYLDAMLTKSGKLVARYNRADGVNFSLPSIEQAFKKHIEFQPDPLSGDKLPVSPGQALPMLTKALNKGNMAVIIDHADTLIPDADMAMVIPEDRQTLVTMREWGQDIKGIGEKGSLVILITSNLSDIHASVRAASSRYEAIRIPYPDSESREKFIQSLRQREWKFNTDLDDKTLVRITAGLNLLHIEDIFLRAEQVGALTWELVSERKREVMTSEFADILQMMEPKWGYENIGGLENVKEFFKKNIIEPMKAGNYGRVPMGVLLTGPAGTGKTIMAEAVAKESGLNMAILNPAKIFSKWVGESERNMEKALEAVKSLAPVIVFIDEIDQSLRRGESGDSGVSNRVFKRLMEFTSDTSHRGQVVFLAATNRPDLLDAALKRPGRFDAKIPFLTPDGEDRMGIFIVMTRKYDFPFRMITAEQADSWVDKTEGWTGAEIERLVIKAKALMDDRKINVQSAMSLALDYIRNKTQDIAFMTKIAIDDCDDLEFIPEKYRKEITK